MTNFLKWFFQESPFHIGILVFMFIITLFWEPDLDRDIARSSVALIFTVLIVGKYRYWKKIQRYL